MVCINIIECFKQLMKISIGAQIIDGPFGGGNEFVKNLSNKLIDCGHEVINNLKDRDIDIIILINPLRDSEISTFDNFDIDYYINFVNKKTISFQRINECDERKNTNFVNKSIIFSNKNIDVNIFVSEWLKKIYLDQGIRSKKSFVFKGGPSETIFFKNSSKKLIENEKIKIVTHHWSNNIMKGFDIYKKLDTLLNQNEFSNKYEFTIIGNTPANMEFSNTKIISPLYGIELSKELKKHDIYITGSKNEPSGNHHMEAAMCGLPILYFRSGGVYEYCKDFGLEYENNNLKEKIIEITENYDLYVQKLNNYPFSFENAFEEFLDFINNVISNKEDIYKNREQTIKFLIFLNYIINKVKKILIRGISKLKIKTSFLVKKLK